MKPGAVTELTPREQFEVRQFREAGVSLALCASYFNVSQRAVKRILDGQHTREKAIKAQRRLRNRAEHYARPIRVLARWLRSPSTAREVCP